MASYFGDFFDEPDALWSVRQVATRAFPFFWLYRVNGILLKMFAASKKNVELYNVNRKPPGPTWISEKVNHAIRIRLSSNLQYYNGIEHVASFAVSNDMLHWVVEPDSSQ